MYQSVYNRITRYSYSVGKHAFFYQVLFCCFCWSKVMIGANSYGFNKPSGKGEFIIWIVTRFYMKNFFVCVESQTEPANAEVVSPQTKLCLALFH